MNIGFISTWFERGAAYVTRAYIDALQNTNDVFVYARGGENFGKGDPKWDLPYVTWGMNLSGTRINYKDFKKWIIQNKINILFFNEQHEMDIVAFVKRDFPSIKTGAYIDYYKEDTVKDFWLYDFLICNTKRHYSVFKDHPQSFYVPWGTDVNLFKPKNQDKDMVTFFHSVGMSKRKGTDLLLGAYIEGEIYKSAKLVIHSQLNMHTSFGIEIDELKKYNIEVIEKTVSAPGLYHLGDVYVYPTTLDGLGLTIYEALACGLPVITTNNAPMNEIVTDEIGRLVKVDKMYSRSNGYYWPLSICSKTSLMESMHYYIKNHERLPDLKSKARDFALTHLDWKERQESINEIFSEVRLCNTDMDCDAYIGRYRRMQAIRLFGTLSRMLPDRFEHFVNTYVR